MIKFVLINFVKKKKKTLTLSQFQFSLFVFIRVKYIVNFCLAQNISKYYYAWIIIIQFMSLSYLEKCQNTISIIYVQCKLYVNLLTNILYVYMKHVYFITRMEWAPLAVNIFLKQNMFGWGWWNLRVFLIFKSIIIKELISNVECAT